MLLVTHGDTSLDNNTEKLSLPSPRDFFTLSQNREPVHRLSLARTNLVPKGISCRRHVRTEREDPGVEVLPGFFLLLGNTLREFWNISTNR